MQESNWLAERFEENRSHLRRVAFRILGSASEAEDAVQEAWLKLSRSDAGEIANLSGWLTTVVARVCLDMLRSRSSRREESLAAEASEPVAPRGRGSDPEYEALLADSVGLALMVVLDRLAPAERLAFVMHDMFGVPFEEIAPVVGRSPEAARQLASRARRRVQGTGAAGGAGLSGRREVVDAFLAALRGGDFEGLLAVLDPDLVFRADRFSAARGEAVEIRGAATWARQAIQFAKGVRFAQVVLVNGEPGAVIASRDRSYRVVRLRFAQSRIVEVEVIGDPARLRELELSVPGI